jgi:TadE-like protein
MRNKSRQHRHWQGQSMIEFALAIPFLLLLLVGMLYFGRYFLISEILLFAAQEGAKVASRTPNLSNGDVRDSLRGFTAGGAATNLNSPIYIALAASRLLSQGNSGNLPPAAKVEILPWDSDGSAGDSLVTANTGTIGVRIDYPMQIMGNPFKGQAQSVNIAMSLNNSNPPVKFLNFTITQRAVAAEEIFQQ